jgi:hypothetical protein
MSGRSDPLAEKHRHVDNDWSSIPTSQLAGPRSIEVNRLGDAYRRATPARTTGGDIDDGRTVIGLTDVVGTRRPGRMAVVSLDLQRRLRRLEPRHGQPVTGRVRPSTTCRAVREHPSRW